MRTHLLIGGASLACALSLCGSLAFAAPVVLGGSSYSLTLTQASTPSGFATQTLNFDGVAETFVHRNDGPVSVTVQESQTDLGGGRYAIDIALIFQGGDPFPFPNSIQGAGVGIGFLGGGASNPGDGLDLTRDVALTAFSVSALAGDDTALFIDLFPDVGWLATLPWNGLSAGGFAVGLPFWQRGLRQMTVHFETLDVRVVSSPGTLPLLAIGLGLLVLSRVRSLSWRRPAVAAVPLLALALTAMPAHAGPVVRPGSSWSLMLNQAAAGTGYVQYGLTFDGMAETFIHTTTAAPVSVTVQESQTDLGGGRASIDLNLSFAGGDPFPDSNSIAGIAVGGVGFSLPLVAGNPLELTGPVALTPALVSAVAGDGQLLSFDALWDFGQLGGTTPWNGRMFGNGFLGLNWAGLGLRQMNLRFETQALNSVPSPGTLPLLSLGLFALAWRGARR